MTKNTNEQLIQDNYRNVYALAHSLAKSYNLAFEAFEDLQKVGYISLIEQSKTFDENSGVPFWTYACKGVKLKMLEELRFILDTVSISPYLNKQIGKVRKIVSANACLIILYGQLGIFVAVVRIDYLMLFRLFIRIWHCDFC